MVNKNQIAPLSNKELVDYRKQVERLENSPLARIYIQANTSFRIGVVSIYSLFCFFGGLWFYHQYNAGNERKFFFITEKLKSLNQKNQDGYAQLAFKQDGVNHLVDNLKEKIDKNRDLSQSLIKLVEEIKKHQSKESLTQKKSAREISSVSKQQKRNISPTRKVNIQSQHEKLLYELKVKHELKRNKFLARNDVSTKEGLKAWKEFSRKLLKERQMLNRIIYNEKKTFK